MRSSVCGLILGWALIAPAGFAADASGRTAAPAIANDIAGTQHSLAEKGAKATVWIFIAHDCPICNAFAPELNRITNFYRTRNVAVNLVYSEAQLEPSQLLAHARTYHFANPLFYDTDFRLARQFKATVTPEAVVVDSGGTVVYRGRIDDRFPTLSVQRPQPTSHDLRDALDDLLAGRHVRSASSNPIGCAIEYQ